VTEEPAQPEQDVAADGDQSGNGQADGGQAGANDSNTEIDRLNRLADRLQGLLERGREADQATQDRIDELQRQLEAALEQRGQAADGSGSGDAPASDGNSLDQLRERLDQLANDQAVSDRLTERLRDLVDQLNPLGEG
jgi:hypothetical protein